MHSIPTRSAFLSNLLGILTIIAGLSFLADISVWYRLFILYPRWAAFAMLAISVMRLFSVVAIWFWSRCGVIAYVLVEIVSMIVWSSVGRLDILNIVELLGAALLLALLRRQWAGMPWGVIISRSVRVHPRNG